MLLPYDTQLNPLTGADDLALQVKSQLSRHYLVQQVLQESAVTANSDLVSYEYCEALLYVAATWGGRRTRSYADFVRWELGLLREPAFILL